MAHRLHHLQKRKFEQPQQSTQPETNNTQYTPQYSTQPNTTVSRKPPRPIFEPTNTIKPFQKQGYTRGQHAYPPPESLYVSKDTQIDPCFIRTSSQVLHTQAHKTILPIAAWITPFANDQVHVVDLTTPLRCSRCKAYVNPYFQFDGTRRSASCNMCGLRFNIQQSVDKTNLQSTEIATQSIFDFRVSDKFYYKKRTDIVKILVVVELSMPMIELGTFSTVIDSLKSVFQSHQFESKIRVGVIFYSDQGVGFIRNNEGEEPTIFLVPNNKNNIFCCPLSDEEYLLDPNSQKTQIISVLEFLQHYSQKLWKLGRWTHQANYINAIKSIKQSFDKQTGKVILFSLLDPRAGPCSIRTRNQQQSKTPMRPINLEIVDLAKELVRSRIGVEHYYFSKDNLVSHQLASTHFLSSLTGGQLHYYSNYSNQSNGQHLYYSIFNTLTRPTYYDADFTCRASNGLTILRYGVADGLRQSRDITQSIVSNTSSYIVELDQQEKLQQNIGAFIQFAMMYTTGSGERRIRVINYKFNVSSQLQQVYESIDYLTLANILARIFTSKLLKVEPAKAREQALNWLGIFIGEFQSKYSGPTCKINDLTVPQSIGWVFSYLNSILNSKLFLNHIKLSPDSKICEFLKIQSSNPYFFATRYYPRVYPITLDIYEGEPMPGDFIENGQSQQNEEAKIAVLPSNLPLTKSSFSENGVYLYDAGELLIILVQHQASEELLLQLFGTSNWEQIQVGGLPELQSSHSIRVGNIIGQIRRRSSKNGGMYLPLVVKTPFKKGPYSQLFNSILKQDNFQCTFTNFIEKIRQGVNAIK